VSRARIGNEDRTKAKCEVGVRNKARGCRGRDAKLFCVQLNVDRGTQERRVAEKGVHGADYQDHCLLEVGPLKGIVGIFGWHGEEGLAVSGVIALGWVEVHCSWDIFFVRMA
jgi:hypothetical protein